MKLSLILLCYNRLGQLKQTMPSINHHDYDELIFADGGSIDGTQQWAQRNYPDAVLVQVPDYPPHRDPKTHNMGVAAATGDIVVVQGAEIKHESRALWHIRRCFEEHRQGIVVTPFTITYEQFGVRPHEESESRRYSLYAILKDDYIAIGGSNEFYIQWGNHDHEFHTRCMVYGYRMIADKDIKVRHIAHHSDPSDHDDHERWLEECEFQATYSEQLLAGKADPVLPWNY